MKLILLLGGGVVLTRYLKWILSKTDFIPIIVTSPRLIDEIYDGESLRSLSKRKGIKCLNLDSISRMALEQNGVDLDSAIGISFGAPWIIKSDFINALNCRIYNLHGTRLPQNRGGGGFSWQIMRGNVYGFALIHQLSEGVDTGDIVAYKEFLYTDCRIPSDFMSRYVDEVLALLIEKTPELTSAKVMVGFQQSEYFSSYWPRLDSRTHGWIDWSWSGEDIKSFIAAFDAPYPGAMTTLNNKEVHLRKGSIDINDGKFHPFQAGLIYRVTASYIAVCTVTGSLIVQEVIDSDGRSLDLNAVCVGDRFFTPSSILEKAMNTRVHFDSRGRK